MPGRLTPGLSYAYARVAHEVCDAVLLDTGFSLAGAVSGRFFDRLFSVDPSLALHPTPVDLRDASGRSMSVRGIFKAPLMSTLSHCPDPVPLEFIVVEGLTFPVVLGNAFLNQGTMGKVNDRGHGLFRLSASFSLQFRRYQPKPASFSLFAAIDSPYTVGARQTCRIPGRPPSSVAAKLQRDQTFVTESPVSRDEIHLFTVTPSVSTGGAASLFAVIVHNDSDSPLTIAPDTTLALCTPCVSMDGNSIVDSPSWSSHFLHSLNALIASDERILGNYGRPDEHHLLPIRNPEASAQEEESVVEIAENVDRPEDDDDRMIPPTQTDAEIIKVLDGLAPSSFVTAAQWSRYRNEVLLPFVDIMKWGPRDPDEVAKVLPPHRIDLLPNSRPFHQQPYQKAPALRAEEARQVGEMLKDGITQQSHSSYASPTVLARKPGGAWRFCVDYRKLNAQTVKDVYPLPRVDDTLDLLRHARYVTTVDLKSGFWQIPIHKDHRHLTAFAFSGGLHEYVFMPFGLCNAPATFQRTMDAVLAGIKWQFCFPYLDDIIIFSRTFEEHLQHVKTVFQRLREHSLSISLKKCQFVTNEVRFLGHIVKDGTLRPNPDKIEAVKAMPLPTDRKSLQSFLGLVNYYRQFIPHFSEVAFPLHQLAANRVRGAVDSFHWTPEHTAAFNVLRDLLVQAPVLHCPDFSRPFVVHTDASDVALGAVLSQSFPDPDGVDREHPVAYLSRVLNEHERNYDTTQRECLAVVFAVKKWRHYLEGTSFKVVTDHIALKWLLDQKNAPNQRLARWILHLQEFTYSIEHRPGIKHQNADALSRCVDSSSLCSMSEFCSPAYCSAKGRSSTCVFPSQRVMLTMSPWSPDSYRTVTLQQRQQLDVALAPLIQFLHHYGVGSSGSVASSSSSSGSLIILPDDAVIPDDTVNRALAQQIRQMSLLLVDGTLSHKLAPTKVVSPSSTVAPAYVPVIPVDLRLPMIEEAHSSLSSGHPGVNGTYQLLRTRCYWPDIVNDVRDFVERCHACQINRHRPSHHIPLMPLPIAPHPFHTVGMDFLKLPRTKSGHQYLLVFTDYLTRWVEAIPTEKQDGATVAKALMDLVVSRHGLPKVLLSDQGKAFCEGVAEELYKKLDVTKKSTTPYHPQCNGLTERFNRTCIEMLSRWQIVKADLEWDEHLPALLWAYRCHWHRDFRSSPFFMLYGRECNVPLASSLDYIDPKAEHFRSRFEYIRDLMRLLPEVWKFASECLQSIADRYRSINDRADPSVSSPLPVGSAVYVRILDSRKIEKGKTQWSGPFIIRRIPSPVNYELSTEADPSATFLIWAGHVRPAIDANKRLAASHAADLSSPSQRHAADSSSPSSPPQSAVSSFDPDDMNTHSSV